MTDRTTLYTAAAQALRDLAAAEKASAKACEARGALSASSTRARITSANARWAACAEDRDRKLRYAVEAIKRAGLNDAPEMRVHEYYEIGSGGYNPK